MPNILRVLLEYYTGEIESDFITEAIGAPNLTSLQILLNHSTAKIEDKHIKNVSEKPQILTELERHVAKSDTIILETFADDTWEIGLSGTIF